MNDWPQPQAFLKFDSERQPGLHKLVFVIRSVPLSRGRLFKSTILSRRPFRKFVGCFGLIEIHFVMKPESPAHDFTSTPDLRDLRGKDLFDSCRGQVG